MKRSQVVFMVVSLAASVMLNDAAYAEITERMIGETVGAQGAACKQSVRVSKRSHSKKGKAARKCRLKSKNKLIKTKKKIGQHKKKPLKSKKCPLKSKKKKAKKTKKPVQGKKGAVLPGPKPVAPKVAGSGVSKPMPGKKAKLSGPALQVQGAVQAVAVSGDASSQAPERPPLPVKSKAAEILPQATFEDRFQLEVNLAVELCSWLAEAHGGVASLLSPLELVVWGVRYAERDLAESARIFEDVELISCAKVLKSLLPVLQKQEEERAKSDDVELRADELVSMFVGWLEERYKQVSHAGDQKLDLIDWGVEYSEKLVQRAGESGDQNLIKCVEVVRELSRFIKAYKDTCLEDGRGHEPVCGSGEEDSFVEGLDTRGSALYSGASDLQVGYSVAGRERVATGTPIAETTRERGAAFSESTAIQHAPDMHAVVPGNFPRPEEVVRLVDEALQAAYQEQAIRISESSQVAETVHEDVTRAAANIFRGRDELQMIIEEFAGQAQQTYTDSKRAYDRTTQRPAWGSQLWFYVENYQSGAMIYLDAALRACALSQDSRCFGNEVVHLAETVRYAHERTQACFKLMSGSLSQVVQPDSLVAADASGSVLVRSTQEQEEVKAALKVLAMRAKKSADEALKRVYITRVRLIRGNQEEEVPVSTIDLSNLKDVRDALYELNRSEDLREKQAAAAFYESYIAANTEQLDVAAAAAAAAEVAASRTRPGYYPLLLRR